ncbi:MAG TPA: protein kinase [Gemmatimonadaceae bacterium]|nr:protein kinase [Gemmatimonadaceae bacterium]
MTDPLRDRVHSALAPQYRIDDVIGRGGMSVVYRAHDVRLHRDVAIKVLPPELAHDASVRSRFTREAQTAAQLAHAHIVSIFDVGEVDGIAYFVMELVRGGTLADHLERHALRPVDEARRVLAAVADALAYAHLRGVIHRDVKPDNILIDAQSARPMVTDFGIARAIEGGARLTQTGIAVGTPNYMSPEQAVGERAIDGRSDIYSLGIVGYQMLTGTLPFTANNAMALLLKQVNEAPRPILELRPETPRALAAAIERAIAKPPGERWPTASAFRDALLADTAPSAWRSELRDPVRYVSPIPRGRRVATDSPNAGSRSAESARPPESGGGIGVERVPRHLAGLTPEQRADLLLWNGRVDLLDRVKLFRPFAVLTGVTWVASVIALAGAADIPPLVFGPIVPLLMTVKLRRRAKSLRASGLQLRRVFNELRALALFEAPAALPDRRHRKLEKLATRAVLESPQGATVRRAAADQQAIRELVSRLSKSDRALVPEIEPTVQSLVEHVVHLAQSILQLDADIDPEQLARLDARIATLGGAARPDDARQLALLQRQRDSLQELVDRRAMLTRQLESAALMLGNLRLDLLKLRASGVESALRDVSNATQQARALSSEIGAVLEVAAELREL